MLEPSLRLLAALACGRRPDLRAVGDVAPLLALAGRLGIVSLLGEALAVSEHPGARRAVASSLLLTTRRERLFDLLASLLHEGASGQPILVKGGALVLSGSLAHRDMVDLDVVVAPSATSSWREAASRVGAQWRPGHGYDLGTITHADGMIEVHGSLPGFVGNEPGPSHERLAPHCIPSPLPDVLVPAPAAAREITVQHFAFHHAGETGHALRVVQDLAALEGEPEGEGLDWGRGGVQESTETLRFIVRQIRDGHDHEDPADGYLQALAGALESDRHPSFADDVERWIDDRPGLSGKTGLVLRRLAPPLAQMRETDDESLLRTLPRYVTRPFRLVAKYLVTRRPHEPAAERWMREIEGLARPPGAHRD